MIQYIIADQFGSYVEITPEEPIQDGGYLYSPRSKKLYEGLTTYANVLRGLPALEVFDRLTLEERIWMRQAAKVEDALGYQLADFLHRFDLANASHTPIWIEEGSNFHAAIMAMASVPGSPFAEEGRAAEILSLT